jgi:hypothetical protein
LAVLSFVRGRGERRQRRFGRPDTAAIVAGTQKLNSPAVAVESRGLAIRISSQFSRKQVSLVYNNRADMHTAKGVSRRTLRGNLSGVTGRANEAQ